MKDTLKAFAEKIEAQYLKAKSKIKEGSADAKLKLKEAELEDSIRVIKEKGDRVGDDAKRKLLAKWKELETKYKELTK